MEELKKIGYEAGITTHKDVREAINENVDKSNSNFQEVMDVYIQDIYELDAAKINDYITNKDSKQSNNATKGYYKIPVAVKGKEGVIYGQMVINKSVAIAYIIALGNGVITLYHYSVTFEESSNLISGITFNYQKNTALSGYLLISDYDNTTITLGVENPFSDSEELQAGRLYNELYGGARLSRIDSADVYELLDLDEDDDPITKHSPYEMTREYSYIYPRLYKQVTWRGYTFKNVFVLTRVLKRSMQIFYTYYFNWYPSNKFAIPGSTYYNQSWVDTPEEGNEVTVGLRNDSLFYDDSGAIYKSGGSALSKITSPDNSAEELMRSMFLQFDERKSSIALDSDNSMGYDIADPDAADSGITKANIILAQTVTYNGGTRAKGTFVAQFTTASGTKYALNWKHSSKLGLADSRYYNNAGANPFTSGTATDPTKYITDDATFKSTKFRGIRGENTYLCKGTGAVYVRDAQSTEWYKVVIDPRMWVESN